jgi:hypothetical protein
LLHKTIGILFVQLLVLKFATKISKQKRKSGNGYGSGKN